MHPRTNHRPAGGAPSLAVALASIVWLAACGNTSVDVLSVRDAGGGDTDGRDGSTDAVADLSVDVSADVAVDVSADVPVDVRTDVVDTGADLAVDASADVAVEAGPEGDGGVACRALGADCSYAGACCSLSCIAVSPPPLSRTCGTGPLCTPAGGSCADNADCCANRCESNVCLGVPPGACSTAGELCSNASECCSARCTAVDGGGTRCTVSGSCRPRGEACGDQQDCCSGFCGPDSRGVQICIEIADGSTEPAVIPGPRSSCGTETE